MHPVEWTFLGYQNVSSVTYLMLWHVNSYIESSAVIMRSNMELCYMKGGAWQDESAPLSTVISGPEESWIHVNDDYTPIRCQALVDGSLGKFRRLSEKFHNRLHDPMKDILLWTFEAGLQKHLIHFHRFEYRFFLHQYKFKSSGHFCVFPEWVSCQIRKNCDLCTRRECRERFPRHRPWKKPIVSDPGMHQWCMSRSLTRGGREKIPSMTGGCATRNFTFFRNSLLPNHRVRSNIAAVSKGPYG